MLPIITVFVNCNNGEVEASVFRMLRLGAPIKCSNGKVLFYPILNEEYDDFRPNDGSYLPGPRLPTIPAISSVPTQQPDSEFVNLQSNAVSVITVNPNSNSSSSSAESEEPMNLKEKKTKTVKAPNRKHILWKFILEQLAIEHNKPSDQPKIIKWINLDEGIFQIMEPNAIAHNWNQLKKRSSVMNFDKMNRALRRYGKWNIIVTVPTKRLEGQRLMYQFRSEEHEWRELWEVYSEKAQEQLEYDKTVQ